MTTATRRTKSSPRRLRGIPPAASNAYFNLATPADLLTALATATQSYEVSSILGSIGDHKGIGLDQPFGKLSLQWRPFGDTESNISTIGLGTKPGKCLVERLTNAVDAELEVMISQLGKKNDALPRSSREAAEIFFSREETGPGTGLFRSQDVPDDLIHCILLPESDPQRLTVDVLDYGIGIRPIEFPTTIMSLQAGNKIKKFYLQGSFGQGGASTLAFADYVLIISRRRGDDHIGFSLIRVLSLGSGYKEDAYAYLVDKNGKVLSVESDAAFPIYDNHGDKLPKLQHGTLVRHYGYRLPKMTNQLLPMPGNLYHFFNAAYFDPLLPFRLIDTRDKSRPAGEIIIGSRNRLMRLLKHSREKDRSGSEVRHYKPMEYVKPIGDKSASIGIEYWVVFNYKKVVSGKSKKESYQLRPTSNELYVQTGNPIVGTLNGQVQGELSSLLLRDIGLPLVSRHLVCHIDATNVSPQIRRELFSSTREGFKDGPVLEGLKATLTSIFENDQKLYDLETELVNTLVSRSQQETRTTVKRQVSALLKEAGFRPEIFGPSLGKVERTSLSHGEPEPGPGGTGEHTASDQTVIKPLPFPQVKRFEITTPAEKLTIYEDEVKIIAVATDASPEFDTRGLIRLSFDPPHLEQVSHTPLDNGRKTFRCRVKPDAPIKAKGFITAVLTKPSGEGKLAQSTKPYEILPREDENKDKPESHMIPPFEIIPVSPKEELFGQIWPEYATAPLDQKRLLAYRPVPAGDGVNVYYNTEFGPFAEIIQRFGNKSLLLEAFTQNYEVWIGYHAIIQYVRRPKVIETLDPAIADGLQEVERSRMGTVEAKQAVVIAELQTRVQKLIATEG